MLEWLNTIINTFQNFNTWTSRAFLMVTKQNPKQHFFLKCISDFEMLFTYFTAFEIP